jgi:hypothetical protein
MNSIGRIKLSEITLNRLTSAFGARLRELPHDLAWAVGPSSRFNRENILKYKNLHNGKRCFIIANGPSLLRTDLNLLINEFTFGVNRIYLRFDTTNFRPTYYVAVNELILEQFSNEISLLSSPKFLNWNRRSFFDKPSQDLLFLKSKMVINDFFQSDLTKPMVFGATVTFVAIQIAYYMGFTKVYIVGLDHDYKEKGIPSKTETRESDKDESHFHTQYFPKGYKWQLPDLYRSEIEYKLAKDAFENDNREIFDATIQGKCPIFNKIDYLSLFK